MSGFFGIIIINSSSSRSRNSNNNRRSIRLRSRNKTNQKEVLEWEKQKSRNLDFPRNQQQQPRPSYQSINQEVEETYDRNQNQNQSHGGEGIESQQTALLSIEYGKYRNIIGMKGGGGEIVQVQGGHIVRSTGRKDRHSKVFTAKGPRDRRVRLSAHTAIQFYDVQDRLGYDRPSKAVDWLIKKAKSAIDKLAELPPWHPISQDPNAASGTSDIALAQHSHDSNYVFPPLGGGGGEENPGNDSAFIAPPLESDPIADTMKSFFPTSSGTSSMNYQSYPPDSSYQNQDLCLSLHSFQDPDGDSNHKSLLAGAAQVGYETNFQRMVSWGGGGGGDSERNGGFGFMFNSPHMPMPQPTPLLGQGSEFSQRGTLQSSFAPAFRAWNELPFASGAMHQSSLADGRFLPGFRIPARIQGEEDHSAVSDRPSSSSPNNSHH